MKEFEPGSAQYPTLNFFLTSFYQGIQSDEQKNIKRKNEREIKIELFQCLPLWQTVLAVCQL